jgi:hypothetical protein
MFNEGTPTKKLIGGPILARFAGHIFVPNPRRILWGEKKHGNLWRFFALEYYYDGPYLTLLSYATVVMNIFLKKEEEYTINSVISTFKMSLTF